MQKILASERINFNTIILLISFLFLLLIHFSAYAAEDYIPNVQVIGPDMTGGTHIATRQIAEFGFQEIANQLDYARDNRDAASYDVKAFLQQYKKGYRAGDPWYRNTYQKEDNMHAIGFHSPFIIGSAIKQEAKGSQLGYRVNTSGVGYIQDVAFGENSGLNLDQGRIGLGGTYTGTSIRAKNPNNAKTTVNSPQLLAYCYLEKSFLFTDISAGLSYNKYEQERKVNFGNIYRQTLGKYSGIQYGTRVRIGYCLARDLFETTPMIVLQYTHLKLNGYTETSASGIELALQKQKFSSMRGGLGLRITYAEDKSNFLPEMRIFYFRELNQPTVNVTAQFIGGGPAFKQENAIPNRDSLLVGLGLTTRMNFGYMKDFYMNVSYDLEKKEKFREHCGKISLLWMFY